MCQKSNQILFENTPFINSILPFIAVCSNLALAYGLQSDVIYRTVQRLYSVVEQQIRVANVMTSTENTPVILESDKKTDSVVILMHGLGADGNDFVPIAPMLELPATRFIFPNAPVIPVTLNGGMPMRAWFDMSSIEMIGDEGRRQSNGDQQQMLASVAMAHALADAQVEAGIPAEHIVFAGFSQGGVIALLAGLTWDQPSAGILALSTYFPDELMREVWPQKPAIYMVHGERDEVIPVQSGRYSYQLLKDSGVDIEFHTYPMGHEVTLDEIEACKEWLQGRLLNKIN